MRLAVYGGASSLLALGVILNALHQRSNFYAACVYLSKSSACIMILLNMGLLLAICFGKTLQAVFFGSLRAIEVEHLYERSWYAVTETCLAMTIFRQEFNLQFVIVFTTLLFLKIFHWLCQDRVEFMEQSPSNRVSFHVRMVNLMALLFIVDCVLAQHAINITLTKGPNMMVMFGFEYTILICTILSTIGKYVLNVIDMRSEEPWEGKSMYVFYLDLLTDFLKLITYLIFFFFICYYYQLPLHIIRDVYVTFRSFIQKCRDLYRYRRATRNMNELYPDATAEDFARMNDSTCIICREEMQVTPASDSNNNSGNSNDANAEENTPPPQLNQQQQQQQNLDQPKKLPCGHVFHFHCLRSWLERQQSCPTCRRSVLTDANGTSAHNRGQVQNQQQQQTPPQPQPPSQQLPQQQQQQQNAQQLQPQQPSHSNGDSSSRPYQADPFSSQPSTNMHYPTSTPQYSQQQQPSSFAILTPEQSSCGTSSAAGPGMIPLIPLSSGISSVPFGATGLSNPSNNNNNHNTAAAATAANPPQPLPASLTDEELQILATTSREAMEQRLRILDTVQNQIFQSMQILTQALSVFPNINNSNTDTTSNNNTNNINSTPADESSAAATSSIKATSDASTSLPSLSSTIEAESHTSAAQRLTSPPTSQTTKPFDITDQQQQSQSDQGISSAYSVVSEQEDGEDAVSSSRRRKGKMPELGSSSNEYQIASDQEE